MESYERPRQSEMIDHSPPEMTLCLRSELVSCALSKQTHSNDKPLTEYNITTWKFESFT